MEGKGDGADRRNQPRDLPTCCGLWIDRGERLGEEEMCERKTAEGIYSRQGMTLKGIPLTNLLVGK